MELCSDTAASLQIIDLPTQAIPTTSSVRRRRAMWRTRRTRDIAQLGSSATEDSGVAIGAAADATAQDGVEEAPRARST